MRNILIGAISGNYSVNNILNWIESSNSFDGVERVLFLYNDTNPEIKDYCIKNNVTVVIPDFDMYGNKIDEFVANSGLLNSSNAYKLVHHIRFFHYWYYLKEIEKDSCVILTDINDVKFTMNPFHNEVFSKDCKIIATSENILFKDERWNFDCMYATLGLLANEEMSQKTIYCAGVIAGRCEELSKLCMDIYLHCIGRPRNADQIAFNYLIQTKYKDVTHFSSWEDKFTVHLHVIASGQVSFDKSEIPNYSIIHQYDRL